MSSPKLPRSHAGRPRWIRICVFKVIKLRGDKSHGSTPQSLNITKINLNEISGWNRNFTIVSVKKFTPRGHQRFKTTSQPGSYFLHLQRL